MDNEFKEFMEILSTLKMERVVDSSEELCFACDDDGGYQVADNRVIDVASDVKVYFTGAFGELLPEDPKYYERRYWVAEYPVGKWEEASATINNAIGKDVNTQWKDLKAIALVENKKRSNISRDKEYKITNAE